MDGKAYHGGDFFKVVGEDFSNLKRADSVINADVLDAWFDPSPMAKEKIAAFLPYLLRTSPPTHAEGLIGVLAERRGIPKEQIAVGGGSSDLMMSLFPSLLSSGDTVMILDPMYGEYPHIFENVLNVKLLRHALGRKDGFRVQTDALIADIAACRPDMVVIVNPNNPTGKHIPPAEMLKIIKAVPPSTIFVVDEAYVEYTGKENSLEREVRQHPNLIVLKSMSKAYALSGARVGYLVASPEYIEKISRFIPPWSVGLIGQVAAVACLNDGGYYDARYEETHSLRKDFIKLFEGVAGVTIHDSCANFFLIEMAAPSKKGASEIIEKLKKEKIFLRNCDSISPQFHDDFIRVAVRDRASNEKVAAAFIKALQDQR